MTKKPKPAAPDHAPSFEDALAEVEGIIERIESGEVGLEQSLTQYERGVALINQCRHTLAKAALSVEDLTKRLESVDQESPGGARLPDEARPGDRDGGARESDG